MVLFLFNLSKKLLFWKEGSCMWTCELPIKSYYFLSFVFVICHCFFLSLKKKLNFSLVNMIATMFSFQFKSRVYLFMSLLFNFHTSLLRSQGWPFHFFRLSFTHSILKWIQHSHIQSINHPSLSPFLHSMPTTSINLLYFLIIKF